MTRALSILCLCLLCGCSASWFAHPLGGKVEQPTRMVNVPEGRVQYGNGVEGEDALTLPYTFRDKQLWKAMQPKPPATKSLAARVAPAAYTRTLAFTTVEQVNVIGIVEAPSITGPWQVVYEEAPKLWIGAGPKRVTFGSNLATAFYKASVRDEP